MLVDINLLPEKEKERSTLLIAALAIISAAIVIWFILFMLTQHTAKQSASMEERLVNLQQSQEDVRATLQISEFATDKQALESTVSWAEDYQFDTVPLLTGLVRLLPERGFFDSFEFVGPNMATLMVQFNTANEAAYYLTRLQSVDIIADATFDSVVAMDETTEETDVEINPAIQALPRYLAVYTVTFFDERVVVETPEETAEGLESVEGGVTNE